MSSNVLSKQQHFYYKLNTNIPHSQKHKNIRLSTSREKFYFQNALYVCIKTSYKALLFNLAQFSLIMVDLATDIGKT
jgi:hypothetical protein